MISLVFAYTLTLAVGHVSALHVTSVALYSTISKCLMPCELLRWTLVDVRYSVSFVWSLKFATAR